MDAVCDIRNSLRSGLHGERIPGYMHVSTGGVSSMTPEQAEALALRRCVTRLNSRWPQQLSWERLARAVLPWLGSVTLIGMSR